ncbi:MAG TPA: EscU/YscU/HrcU family type III secretion system export apparatus switch protein [Solirubrobacteraceae bacterium]|jgi:flagellar biosynthetic protein FlhB|nr:EscU/YscU/HrcU family type III secretion system export apparatus switch protein [Solirubrobacteraceae bacterium]
MPAQDRTEKATPKHREDARKKGQVARSPDLSGALALSAGLLGLSVLGPGIAHTIAASFRETLGEIGRPAQATSAAGLRTLFYSGLQTIALSTGPIAGICMATGLIAGVAQVGLRPSPQALSFDLRRINPIAGARNLLGANLVFLTLKTLAKLSAVGAFAGFALIPGTQALAAHVGIPPATLGVMIAGKAIAVAQRAAFAYLLIGVIDYAWQRRRHEKRIRMTKQELKDETRRHGLPAEVKSAIRRRQLQAARARMMAAVPEADVVVTNPTHYAVALRYDGTRTAPEVVAKGKDLIAAQIRRVAEEHEVPIVADPPLARALHGSVEIGQMIPAELYAAVAQVLAFVYRMAARRRGVA